MIIKYWKINKLQAKKAAGRYIRYTKKFYEFLKKKRDKEDRFKRS